MSDPESISPTVSAEPALKRAMPGWFIQLSIGLAVAIVAFILGVAWQRYDARIRHLSYLVSISDSIIPTDKVEGAGIDIEVDGDPIANISTVAIAIYNTTDRDFDSIPLSITLTYDGNERVRMLKETGGSESPNVTAVDKHIPSWEMLSQIQNLLQGYGAAIDEIIQRMRSQGRLKEEDIARAETSLKYDYAVLDAFYTTFREELNWSGKYKAHYDIVVANRSNEPIFYVEYIIASAKAPAVDISIVKKGVDLEPIRIANLKSPYTSTFLIVMIIASILVGVGLYNVIEWAVKKPLKAINMQSP